MHPGSVNLTWHYVDFKQIFSGNYSNVLIALLVRVFLDFCGFSLKICLTIVKVRGHFLTLQAFAVIC